MRFPRALVLLFALAASSAYAIDSAPDEAAEDDKETDSYIPNRFAITLHGEYAFFVDSHHVDDSGGGGVRVGFRVNRWAELEFGVDYLRTNLPAHGHDGSVVDLGAVNLIPIYLEARIDITHVDSRIPWPLPWCRPMLIGGLGFAAMHVKEEADAPINLSHKSGGPIVRGGAGIEFGAADARVTFGVEWIYTWVAHDIKVDDPSGNLPGRLNMDYWSLGAYVSLRF